MQVVGWVCPLCIIYLGYTGLHLLAPALNITVTLLELCLLCLISSKKSSGQMNMGGLYPSVLQLFFSNLVTFLVIGTGILCARSFP